MFSSWGIYGFLVVVVSGVAAMAAKNSSGKRRRVTLMPPKEQERSFEIVTSDEGVGHLSRQQVARLGEVVAGELETRTVEPFVAR